MVTVQKVVIPPLHQADQYGSMYSLLIHHDDEGLPACLEMRKDDLTIGVSSTPLEEEFCSMQEMFFETLDEAFTEFSWISKVFGLDVVESS
ncbi:MAG: hypothetical protein JXA82_13425 [Sedimentisphaerales bacterium]|nr:hypothetical protein [Sedimentisphaerales bacterium]